MNTQQSLYEQDYYAWTMDTVEKLKHGHFEQIDVDHLMEEVESMGISERSALESRMVVLIMHLLKWQIQQSNRCNSWKATIEQQRLRIKKLLKKMPSLKNILTEIFNDEDNYKDAVLSASKETGLSKSTFPNELPYTLEQLLDEDFYPMS